MLPRGVCAAFPAAARRLTTAVSKDKVVVTASLNGVLTDPAKFPVPVTPTEMAVAAEQVRRLRAFPFPRITVFSCIHPFLVLQAYNAGASVVHIHIRDQRPGKGHLPSWDPAVALDVVTAIRKRVPSLIVNMTTGTIGKEGVFAGGDLGPTEGPIACLASTKPEMAALNSGSLNYLKVCVRARARPGQHAAMLVGAYF